MFIKLVNQNFLINQKKIKARMVTNPLGASPRYITGFFTLNRSPPAIAKREQ